MCEQLTLQNCRELISSTGATHANRSASQGNSAGNTTTGICGQQCLQLSRQYDQLGLLQKTLKGILPSASMTFCGTWMEQVTPQGRSLSRLAPSARTIRERGFLLWPTPQAMDAMHARGASALERQMQTSRAGRTKLATLKDAAVYGLNWTGEATRLGDGELNPEFVEWLMGFQIGWTDLEHSGTQ